MRSRAWISRNRAAERLRAAGQKQAAAVAEGSTRALFLVTVVAIAAGVWLVSSHW